MYDFDEIIDRRNTNALNTDGFRQYIFKDDGTMTFPYEDNDFVRMWVADMEFATPDVVIEGIQQRLNDRIFGYTRLSSDKYFQVLDNWCRTRYEWHFDKEHLVLSNGVVPALYELVEYICTGDDKVLFLTPSYEYFKFAAEVNGREPIASDLVYHEGRYQIDFEDLADKASDERAKVLILCNPHNPTGRVWSEEELKSIAKIAEKNDLWVISDEIHCDLLRCGQKHIPFGKIFESQKLITCMAPSKTFNLAGMMLSNIIIRDESLRQTWLKNHYNFDHPLSIAAAQAAYEKGQDWLDALRRYLDENFRFTKDFLEKRLSKVRMDISESTYLAWVDVHEYFEETDDLPLFFAYNAGVLLEASHMFVQNADGFIRLNLACPKRVLEKGLERICAAIEKKEQGLDHWKGYLAVEKFPDQ